jgi:hypothetical protein
VYDYAHPAIPPRPPVGTQALDVQTLAESWHSAVPCPVLADSRAVHLLTDNDVVVILESGSCVPRYAAKSWIAVVSNGVVVSGLETPVSRIDASIASPHGDLLLVSTGMAWMGEVTQTAQILTMVSGNLTSVRDLGLVLEDTCDVGGSPPAGADGGASAFSVVVRRHAVVATAADLIVEKTTSACRP